MLVSPFSLYATDFRGHQIRKPIHTLFQESDHKFRERRKVASRMKRKIPELTIMNYDLNAFESRIWISGERIWQVCLSFHFQAFVFSCIQGAHKRSNVCESEYLVGQTYKRIVAVCLLQFKTLFKFGFSSESIFCIM